MCSSDGGLADRSTKQLVEAALGIARELARREAPSSGAAAVELTEPLSETIDMLEATMASFVGCVDSSGAYGLLGCASTAAWLRRDMGMRHGRASERVRLARHLPRLPRTAQRLRTGRLSLGKAAVIAQAVTRLDDHDAATAEDALLKLIDADSGLSADRLTRYADRVLDMIHQRNGSERQPEDARRGYKRSWMTIHRSMGDGFFVKGYLTPEDGATVSEVLAPLARPAGSQDDRDHAQRTADALLTVLCKGHRDTNVTLVIDLAAFQRATGIGPDEPVTRRSERPGPSERPLSSTRAPARMIGGAEITPERARQIALSAGIHPLIVGTTGLPLSLGRRKRCVSGPQRKALLALYETCSIDGCDIPAYLCEIHHLGGGWKLGIPTDIDRLVPACRFHNQWMERHPDRVGQRSDHHGRTVITIAPPRPCARAA